MTNLISTDRLKLIVMSPTFLRASLEADLIRASLELKTSIPTDWPGDARDVLSIRLDQLADDPTLEPWLLRAMVRRDDNVMVGHIGFHTAPGPAYLEEYSPGAIEFGFTVFPEYRRQGYAREASIGLMNWASEIQHVNRFVMSIRPDNLPSQNLAAQLGFVRIGSHVDEVDGREDVLERIASVDE